MPKPPIKWVGGKTQLLPEVLKYFPTTSKGTYYEPFIGGGAVFWNVRDRFQNCVINDWNWELVTTYKVLQDFPEDLIKKLQEFELLYGKEEFLHLRDLDPIKLCLVMRAARFMALNRWGFNGLFRVNKSGKFNVPFGSHSKPPTLANVENLLACSKALKDVDILQGDFEGAVATAEAGDVVYFDPPYVPLNPTSDFTSYTSEGFGLKDQQRLAACVRDLHQRGVSVILSNSYTPTVLDLYKGFSIFEVQARRSVNSKGTGRGKISEALVVTAPQPLKLDLPGDWIGNGPHPYDPD